jgi:hypothetical protein
MDYTFTYKGHNYTYNAATNELRRVTTSGGTVPVIAHHPSLTGISEHIKEHVLTR